MDNENIITLQLQLTRRKAFLLLTFFFLCWHPGFLGSETLTLTTYYPAPYGGYASLLTTGQTLLARDGGNVGIGTGAGGVPGYKLTVQGGIGGNVAFTPSYTAWWTYAAGDGGAAIYNDASGYNTLMIVGNASGGGGIRRVGVWDDLNVSGSESIQGSLNVNGNISSNGSIINMCQLRPYSQNGQTWCLRADERVITWYGDGAPDSGMLLRAVGLDITNSQAWKMVGLAADRAGNMLCCRIQ